MIRKAASVLLIMAMLLPAAACSQKAAMEPAGEPFEFDKTGVKIDNPFSEDDLNGFLNPSAGVELDGSGIYYSLVKYVAMTEDEYVALASKEEITEEDIDYYQGHSTDLLHVYTINCGRSYDELVEGLQIFELDGTGCIYLGSDGEYNFFYKLETENTLDGSLDPVYFDELSEASDAYADGSLIHFSAPVPPLSAEEGALISFETYDLEGNKVTERHNSP